MPVPLYFRKVKTTWGACAMSKFTGFGLLLENEKGEWTINGEVIGEKEKLIFLAFNSLEDQEVRQTWTATADRVFRMKDGTIELNWWECVCDAEEEENREYVSVGAFFAFKARRMFSTMLDD